MRLYKDQYFHALSKCIPARSSTVVQKSFVFWLAFEPINTPSLVISRKFICSLRIARNSVTVSLWCVGFLCHSIKIRIQIDINSIERWNLPVFCKIRVQVSHPVNRSKTHPRVFIIWVMQNFIVCFLCYGASEIFSNQNKSNQRFIEMEMRYFEITEISSINHHHVQHPSGQPFVGSGINSNFSMHLTLNRLKNWAEFFFCISFNSQW